MSLYYLTRQQEIWLPIIGLDEQQDEPKKALKHQTHILSGSTRLSAAVYLCDLSTSHPRPLHRHHTLVTMLLLNLVIRCRSHLLIQPDARSPTRGSISAMIKSIIQFRPVLLLPLSSPSPHRRISQAASPLKDKGTPPLSNLTPQAKLLNNWDRWPIQPHHLPPLARLSTHDVRRLIPSFSNPTNC
ncbi:hypothetical protein PSHT_01076 [Puccinia striiformis]|uniref:Uncharacterized protein n=1 Tax=Puccinia striiformis TaxID=27350 RepID=A0A2S4WLF7_9BASI|nr:hypothetical protein PSHT_01076 [Puccinia striiformis]